MNLFYKRPLLLALFLFLVTNILCSFFAPSFRKIGVYITLVLTLLFLTAFLICKLAKKQRSRIFSDLALCTAFCLIAFISSHDFFDKKLVVLENKTEEVTIVADIRSCTYRASYSTVYIADVLKMNGADADFTVELTYAGECALGIDDRIEATVTLSAFSRDIYGFNERNMQIANGVLVSAACTEYTLLGEAPPSLHSFFSELRDKISARVDAGKLQDAAPLLKALLLGETDALDGTVKLDFRRLGISHILSISGTHFTTLLGMVAVFLSLLGLNKRVVYVLLIPLAFFYMGLTGFSAAVCRAGIMSILSYWGFLCGRMRDSYTALFIAVAAILLISPHAVCSIGLWLSFSATFAILVLMELLSVGKLLSERSSGIYKFAFTVLSHILVTILVSFVTLPLTAACFGEISIAAPLGNLVLVPLFEIFLYIAPFAVIFSGFAPLAKLTNVFCNGILALTEKVCEIDGLLVSVQHDFVLWIAIIGCAITLLLLALPLRKKGLILLPAGVSILCISLFLFWFADTNKTNTSITCFTVGDNDGIVLVDNLQALCIDISNGGSASAYKAEYIAAQQHCPEISAYMFTHYHNLHVNQFLKLTGRTRVYRLYLPRSDDPDDAQKIESLCQIAADRNIEIVWLSYGVPLAFENCTVTLWEPQDISRSTHDVIYLQISAKDTETLYLGSSYQETDLTLHSEIAESEYIFYGHHSPIVKKKFTANNDAFQIYGSELLTTFAVQGSPDVILQENDQYSILLK